MYLALIKISISFKEREIILGLSKRVTLIEEIGYTNGERVDSTPWHLFLLNRGLLTLILEMSDLWATLRKCKNRVR